MTKYLFGQSGIVKFYDIVIFENFASPKMAAIYKGKTRGQSDFASFILESSRLLKLSSNICARCSKILQRRNLRTNGPLLGLWEPDNLNPPPEIPEYGLLNVQLKGYDFPVLENYTKYVNNIADKFDIDANCYAVPGKTSLIDLYLPSSTNIKSSYKLTKYERVIQINGVPSTVLPTFIEAIRVNVPAGVEVTIKKANDEDEEARYIPDKEKIALKERYEELEVKKSDLKKGKVN